MAVQLEEIAKRVETVLNRYGADVENIMTHPDGMEMVSDFIWALGIEVRFAVAEREDDD